MYLNYYWYLPTIYPLKRLTVTLDVFKCNNKPTVTTYTARLTVTLDVFKCL